MTYDETTEEFSLEEGDRTSESDNEALADYVSSSDTEEMLDDQTEDKKAAAREKSAMGIIRKVERLLSEGKEVPSDLQWAVAHADPSAIKTPEKTENSFDEAIRRHEDKKLFEANKDRLSQLPAELRKKLTLEANELKSSEGVGIATALKIILKAHSSEIDSVKEKSAARKSAATLPSAATASAGDTISEEALGELGARARKGDKKALAEFGKWQKLQEEGKININ